MPLQNTPKSEINNNENVNKKAGRNKQAVILCMIDGVTDDGVVSLLLL